MLIFVYPPTVIQLSTSKLCYTKIFAYMCDICPWNMKATSIWNAILRMCLNQDLYVYMACFYIVPNLKCNTAPPAHLCFVQTPLLLQVSLTRLFPTDGNVFLFENFHFFFFFFRNSNKKWCFEKATYTMISSRIVQARCPNTTKYTSTHLQSIFWKVFSSRTDFLWKRVF